MTAIGTRRPREGRCERCDRPLTDEVYAHFDAYGANGREVRSTHPEWMEASANLGECCGGALCSGPSVDWRARALAAEADLQDVRDVLTDQSGGALIAGDGSVAGDVAMRLIDLSTACVNALADAEARGRLHGLFEAWCELYPWTNGMGHTMPGARDVDFASARDLIAGLAAEATDGR